MMKNKSFTLLKNIISYLFAFLVGLYLVVLATGSFMALSTYKLDLPQHFSAVLSNLAKHPIHFYTFYLSQKNPMLILLSIVVFVYLVYFALKRSQKNKKWETADTETHGSATWGNMKDLQLEYFKITPKNLQTNFTNSLNQETIKQLQERGKEE